MTGDDNFIWDDTALYSFMMGQVQQICEPKSWALRRTPNYDIVCLAESHPWPVPAWTLPGGDS